MLAIFSDTHSDRGHELTDAASHIAREADAVVHAGDFTSVAALEAFQALPSRLYAVHGNADGLAVRDRLPTERVLDHDGVRLAVTHRRDGGQTALSLFGRANDADVVVSGHTHRPALVETDDTLLLNPGSHAQPRGNRPGFAALERVDDRVEVRLLDLEGAVVESVPIDGEH
ncbi:metallophosphoesterase [Halobacteria archaeon AArc-dxtr1]|nr:metallophosphoesterase [Halobacteria archaeon AArc-dxtr1]